MSGEELQQNAEKALKKFSIMSVFGGDSSKYEEAHELYVLAGNAFKIKKSWEQASVCFERAAEISLKNLDSKTDACNHWIEAGACLRRTNATAAAVITNRAIELYKSQGRFSQAARYLKEAAEAAEQEGNVELAIQMYAESLENYGLESSTSHKTQANACMQKIATLDAQLGKFTEAAELFDQLGRDYLEARLLSLSAKTYFQQALMCHMAMRDMVAVRTKLDLYKQLDHTFASAPECKFIENLADAIESGNADDFAQVCADYDRTKPLDAWRTNILVTIKRGISGGGDGGLGGDEPDLS